MEKEQVFVCGGCGLRLRIAVEVEPAEWSSEHPEQRLIDCCFTPECPWCRSQMRRADDALPRLPPEVLVGYSPDTACLRLRDAQGQLVDHFIGALAGTDNEQTLRAHVAQRFPGQTLVAWAIK